MEKEENKFSDLKNVEYIKENLIPEEFPEGAFDSSIGKQDPIFSKSTPWKEGQRRQSAFVYPDKERHDDLPRRTPGSHPLHDE